jgi:hypothetical protein
VASAATTFAPGSIDGRWLETNDAIAAKRAVAFLIMDSRRPPRLGALELVAADGMIAVPMTDSESV